MKNRLITMMVCGLLLASLAGCGDSKAPADDGNTQQTEQDGQQQESGEDQQDTDAPKEGGEDAQAPEEGGGDAQMPEEDFSLAMTDSYTFTDPADLEFDQRYVLTGDENCKFLSDMINAGYEVTTMYDIVYVNGEEAAGEYQYFVTTDEENAQALKEFYASQGQNVTQEGNILYAYIDGEVLQANIITFSGMGMMSGETVKDYVDFMMGTYGLIEY